MPNLEEQSAVQALNVASTNPHTDRDLSREATSIHQVVDCETLGPPVWQLAYGYSIAVFFLQLCGPLQTFLTPGPEEQKALVLFRVPLCRK